MTDSARDDDLDTIATLVVTGLASEVETQAFEARLAAEPQRRLRLHARASVPWNSTQRPAPLRAVAATLGADRSGSVRHGPGGKPCAHRARQTPERAARARVAAWLLAGLCSGEREPRWWSAACCGRACGRRRLNSSSCCSMRRRVRIAGGSLRGSEDPHRTALQHPGPAGAGRCRCGRCPILPRGRLHGSPAFGDRDYAHRAPLPPPKREQLYEITLEPAGGSPTGKPTGPIIARALRRAADLEVRH